MSTESVKGSEGDNLTSSSDAPNGPKQDPTESTEGSPDKIGKATSDSEGESKIQADSKEAEKQRSPSAGSRSGSEKEAEEAEGRRSGSPGRQSRASSGGRKSPGGTSRPKSSDSRPKSSSSGEVTFEAKSKRKKKKGAELFVEGHQVTFTVTISVAIPTGKYLLHFFCTKFFLSWRVCVQLNLS